jgi:hypothetical protein
MSKSSTANNRFMLRRGKRPVGWLAGYGRFIALLLNGYVSVISTQEKRCVSYCMWRGSVYRRFKKYRTYYKYGEASQIILLRSRLINGCP